MSMSRALEYLFMVLVILVQVACADVANPRDIKMEGTYGGDYGVQFKDLHKVSAGQTVESITIRAGDRVDGVGIVTTLSSGERYTINHGGSGGKTESLELGRDEYIKSMEVHVGKKDGRRRVVYIKFVTSTDRPLAGGTPTQEIHTLKAPEGFQLGGFWGAAGDELDTLGAIWARIVPS